MSDNLVKELRLKLGLTQEAMARKLGVAFVTVNRWENGKTKPSNLAINMIQKLASKKM